MTRTLITNANIWDASGGAPYAGDVLIEGNRIRSIKKGGGEPRGVGDQVIDGTGLFLMPGMVEGHAHLSFENAACTEDLVAPIPEEQVFATARSAKALLEAGFTSAYGASEAKQRVGIAVRNEVNKGRIPGPRIRAAGLEISVTGAMGDESKEHYPKGGLSILVDGADEMRKAVRLCCREGLDNIKLDVSGDPFYPGTPGHSTPMSYDEVRVAVETAHAFGRKVNAHTRSIDGSKYCVRAGVDGLLHCEYSDEELLDMMEEAKDRIFVAPTVSLWHTIVNGEASPNGLTPEVGEMMGIPPVLEAGIKTHTELRKRGIRHLIGGDYGFAWSPNGTNARDLQFFVDYYGYTPSEALVCATRYGGLAMRDEGDLGTITEGSLADMLLVNGNPLEDLTIMTDKDRLVMIMKDGQIYKNEVSAAQRLAAE